MCDIAGGDSVIIIRFGSWDLANSLAKLTKPIWGCLNADIM